MKILFDDETVEQVFSVFVLVDRFSSGLSVFGDMSSKFQDAGHFRFGKVVRLHWRVDWTNLISNKSLQRAMGEVIDRESHLISCLWSLVSVHLLASPGCILTSPAPV